MAFYGRVSTEEQADRGNIAGQVEFARMYFDLHGPSEKIRSYEMYLDEGVSGTLSMEDRPEGARLMADARSGRIKAVYFYRLDRLARSTQVVLSTYNELEKLNIPIKSMTEAFDTGTPVGKFFMTLLASIAALERDTILERTQMGKERKAREGCWTSGPPPFGYRVGTEKRLVVFEPEAETVRLIFRLYNEGMSMVPLAEYLNARGIPTPTTSKSLKKPSTGLWHAGHISIILRSLVYTGEYRTMKRSRKGKNGTVIRVEPIITRDEFQRAGKLLSENGDMSRGRRGRNYLLRGLVYCGICGLAMVGNKSGNGGRSYYRCTGTVNHGRGKVCGNRQVRAEEIEQAIWEDIKVFIKNPGRIIELTRIRLDGDGVKPVPEDGELAEVVRAIAGKKAGRSRILSLVARSLVSDSEAEAELEKLAAEIELLNRRRNILADRYKKCREVRDDASGMADLLKKISERIDGISPNPELIRLLVNKVEINTKTLNGKTVPKADIYYRFSPGPTGPSNNP
ncbi:MAG: recombinase family protein [Bacillota bacterium]